MEILRPEPANIYIYVSCLNARKRGIPGPQRSPDPSARLHLRFLHKVRVFAIFVSACTNGRVHLDCS